MRIDRLDLIAFGPFKGVTLDLSGGSEGLHVVYGPNEAGKSSALRAIRQFFCDFPVQSKDTFALGTNEELRVGMVLRGRDGSVVEATRRKGSKNKVLLPGGDPVDDAEAFLSRALGGTGADEFGRRFVIDHAELVAGGRDMAAGKGDLARALFAAGGGAGLARVGGVQKDLKEDAEKLFKPRTSIPAINANLATLEDYRNELKAAELPSQVWVAHDRALRDAHASKETVERELVEAEREQRHLKRLAEAVEPAARRRDVVAELAALAGVPRLAGDFKQRLGEVASLLPSTERSGAEARRRVAELTADLDALDVPGPLLDRAEAIEELHQRLGERRKAAADRLKLESDLGRVEAEARAALRDLGRDPAGLELAAVLDGDGEGEGDGPFASLRLAIDKRAAVLDLADQRTDLQRDRDDARRKLDAATRRRASAAAALDDLGPERDPAALRKAVKSAQKAGDLDAQLASDRDALDRDEARAAADLAALGPRAVTIEAVESLAVPPAEAIDRSQSEFDALDRDEADLKRQADDLDAQLRQADAGLETLRLEGDVPTEEALADARRRRDQSWDRLRQARAPWDDAAADAHEPLVREADGAADRLRREAGRVADLARLRAERRRLAAERDDRLERLGKIGPAREALRARWSSLWAAALRNEPSPPPEMRAWLRRHDELVKLARSVREARGRLAARQAQADTHRRALADALAQRNEPTAPPDEPLADLLERADDALTRAAAAATDRKRLTKERDALDADRPDLEEAAASAGERWEQWQGRWASAVGRLGLGPEASSAEARAVLKSSETLFDRIDRGRSLRREVESVAREAGRFVEDVRALAARVAPDLMATAAAVRRNGAGGAPPSPSPSPDFDPEAAAAELYQRLNRARAARQEREHLLQSRAEKEREAEGAEAAVAGFRDTLADLRREARCDGDDELPAVEARDARRRALEDELARLDRDLVKHAAGAPLDAFLGEVAGADPDALGPRIDRLSERVAALHRDREAADQTIGRESSELARMKGGSDAAEVSQKLEDLRARARETAEQYARLRLAAAVLRAGIERYREKAQGPVIARAGATFARLTLGSFTGLSVDYDGNSDEPALRGVRPSGEALKVDAMSLGTADQLFLALRLATLDAFLDRHEPLPLIVDDVLIQFDDARAGATLDVLADFSKRTQVLLFTHHDHLTRLAAARLAPGALFVHTLPGTGPT